MKWKILRDKLLILKNLVLKNIDLEAIEKIASEETRTMNVNKDEIEYPFYLSFLKDKHKGRLLLQQETKLLSFYYNDNIEFQNIWDFE